MERIPHLRSSTKGGLACVAKSLLQVCPLPSRLCLIDPPPSHPYARFVLRCFIAAPPVRQPTLPASSVKTSTLGVCMTPLHISPLPHNSAPSLPPPLYSPKLALSFAGITSVGQRVTLPATSSKKSTGGVSLTLHTSLPCRTALVHALPYLQHYACFFLRLPDTSGACK